MKVSDMDVKPFSFFVHVKHISKAPEVCVIGCTEDNLTWKSLKSFLEAKFGGRDTRLAVSYIDMDGDEVPIESDGELKEALKVSRQLRQQLYLLIDKKLSKPDLTCSRFDKKSESFAELKEKDKKQICSCGKEQGDEEAPRWFKKSLRKIKSELIEEIKIDVAAAVKEAIRDECKQLKPTSAGQTKSNSGHKSKKRVSDEESDGAFFSDQRDLKLLKKIEKIHRRGEKKFEKLDTKLEKLENKTKRLLEKKTQSRSRKDKCVEVGDENPCVKTRKNSCTVATYLMDAILLQNTSKVTTLQPGQQFVKVWHVMNNGTLPWTDKTELCLSWGTPGLCFEKNMLKCPQLEPGEKGKISVRAVAPMCPGTFESYWHFYHMGDRFGHWIDCAVLVEPPQKLCKEITPASVVQPAQEVIGTYKHIGEEVKKIFQMAELTQELQNLQKNIQSSSQQKIFQMAEWTQELQNLQKNMQSGNQQEALVSKDDTCVTDKETQVKHVEKENEINGHGPNEDYQHMEKGVKEKIIQMAELTHELHNLQKNMQGCSEEETLVNGDVTSETVEENQRKIAANMVEIQKRLDDITILHTPPSADKILQMAFGEQLEDLRRDDDLIDLNHITGENIEPAEWEQLQAHPEFLKAASPVVKQLLQPSGRDYVHWCTHVREAKTDRTGDEKVEKCAASPYGSGSGSASPRKREIESESDVDSELSVISSCSRTSESEDDGNFILVPREELARSQSSDTVPVTDDLPAAEEEEVEEVASEAAEAAVIEQPPTEHSLNESQSKKRKSCSDTTYSFQSESCTTPPQPFLFTAECCGHCHPRKEMHKLGLGKKPAPAQHPPPPLPSHQQKTQPTYPGEQPVMNVLPNSLVDGAINVASSAISTARSVINNLQSAFVPGTEEHPTPGTTPQQLKFASAEAMFHLYDMGFHDLETNRRLLLENQNTVEKVIDDLVNKKHRFA